MTTGLRCLAGTFVTAAALAHAAPAHAGDSRFERVVLLPSPDRVSVVFELTGEPTDVTTRRVSAALFELDAGPVVMAGQPQTYVAPPGVRFVASVAIEAGAAGGHGLLKARITLDERSRSSVRVVGRRVYVDFSAGEAPRARPAPRPERPERRTPPSPPAAPAPAEAVPAATYQAVVQPAIERLEQLTPFLISASKAPSASVLQALGTTLTDIRASVHAMEVPGDSRDAHGLLSSAIALAMTAVDPAFTGDRMGQTQQALALLDRAKAAL